MKLNHLLVALLLGGSPVFAQENLTYQKPPAEIMALAEFERAPQVRMDTKKEHMLLMYRSTYKSLEDLNEQEVRLGGMRINPITNSQSNPTFFNNLKVRKIKSRQDQQVQGLPADARISNLTWSPNEAYVVFTHTTVDGLELWILDLQNAQAKKLLDGGLNGAMGSPVVWYNDGTQLLVRMLPKNRAKLIDETKSKPAGPIVQTADGSVSQNRTLQDLLKNKTDEHNFEALVSAELYTLTLDGQMKKFKDAAIYSGISFSPDGNYILLSTIEKPFSYIVAANRFPQKSTVYTTSGEQVKVVNELPLNEVMAKGFMAVRQGKRNLNWRADEAATLFFVEALDEGDPAKKVDFRDEAFVWAAPFNAAPKSLFKTQQRFGNVIWGDAQHAIISDQWYDTRNTRTFLFNPSQPQQAPRLITDRNSQDVYSDPGNFETKKNAFGRYVMAIEGGKSYLIGQGHSPKGQFPFIDELDLKSLKTKRLYQSTLVDKKETIQSIEDFKKGEVLVQIQSSTEFPNYYLKNIKSRIAPKQLTDFVNPFESFKNVHKEVIKYKRKDGVELSGTLYLPAGYDRVAKKEKLPLLIWAYPAEFKDKNSASQSTKNANEFTAPSAGSFVYWAARGYAVLNDAAFPIIGEGEAEPNDTFVQQLVDNAEAAIQALDKLGYINPKKVGVGGHSYGAFMTANLLTHSNLFAVGIARSGAYNRTLTPFGFQNEQRNYWERPDIYNAMSPFMNASKMKTPMLLVHGEADNNPGTFTLQTERYFQALKGLGAPVRMVILPKESHGYAAKENIFHVLWETDRFLEKYLK